MPSYPQGDLESPFLKEELFIGETGAGLEPRLAALEAESPFQHAFEESSESAVEPEPYEEELEGEEGLDDSFLEYLDEPEQEELFLETETPYAEEEELGFEVDHDQDEGEDAWTVPRPQVDALETATPGHSPKVGHLADREAVRVDEESEQIAAELERIASHSGFLGEPQVPDGELWHQAEFPSIFALGPPSAAADLSVAVPPFNFFKRLLLPVSVLDATQNASAIRWNQRQHPRVSGVDPSDIRIDLQRYVNLTAIQAAINNFNQANPSAQIAAGTPPIDAVFVEAVHQFQAKCFFETSQIDGLAGESTIDSLGLVKRSGLNTADKPNTGAVKRLKMKKVDVPGETGNEFSADSWFDFMVNPTFLGWRFTTGGAVRGVHLFLMRKFRIAEKALLAQSKYRGMTPVELGKALGFNDKSEEHRGARPDATTASMHTYGLAVDIKYSQNPWVRGANFTNTLKRAALLISGEQITQATSEQFFHSLGADPNRTTEQIFEILSQRDRDFRHYLRLHDNSGELQNILNQRQADRTPGVFASSAETVDQATRRWQGLIRQDRANMRAKNSPFRKNGGLREPLNGFLNFNKDLVVALRDKACLAWGAVDIGPRSGGSGDIMHFDARVCGLGDRLASVGGNFRVTPPLHSGHPCLPCPAAGGSSAATTGELDAEEEEPYSEDVTHLEREPLTPTDTWIEPEDEEDIYPQEEATYKEEALTNVVEEGESFPSGESLPVLTGLPEGKGEDYWDPTGSGNPLLNTGPLHKDKKLSANYTVRELTTSGGVSADVARIDPKLVGCLQKIRDHVGRAVTITSGYRSWKRNKEIYQKRGREPTLSQHCAGRAADIKIQGMNGVQIGKAAIDAYGPNIGVGLGNTFAHIDVRGYAEAWNYGGVEPRWIKEIKDYQQAKGGSVRRAPATAPRPGAARSATTPPAELVRFAQRVLNATEGERLDDDGDLGPLTRGALERFRRKYDLGAGGVLDDKTQLALAQRALEELAQESMFEKGKRDVATDQALSEFKVQRGLGAEPTLDAATRAALADALERRVGLPSTPPTGAVTNWAKVDPSQRMRYVMGLLVNNYQYPENGAAGIVGNLWAESGVLPNRIQGSKPNAPMRARDFTGKITEFTAEQVMNRKEGKQGPRAGGIGLAQWTKRDRRAGLFNHTFQGRKLGANILYNMDAQVDYLVSELQSRGYRQVNSILKRPNVSLEEASDEVVYNYEIPGSILTTPKGRPPKLPRNHPSVIEVFRERRSYSRNALRAYQQPIPN